MPPPKDHDCEWQAYAKDLEQKLEALMQRTAQLEKKVLGPQSEKRKKAGKMPPPVAPASASKAGREARRDLRTADLETEVVAVPVPPEALGRKVFLFVGNVEAGENVAGLYSLVASCELHGVNAIAYLSDVLLRIDRHPASKIDELLPDAWAAAQ